MRPSLPFKSLKWERLQWIKWNRVFWNLLIALLLLWCVYEVHRWINHEMRYMLPLEKRVWKLEEEFRRIDNAPGFEKTSD